MKKISIIILSLLMPFVLHSMDGNPLGSSEERQTIREGVRSIYEVEGCGICKGCGGDIFWFGPHSRCAHQSCFDFIAEAQAESDALLEEYCSSGRSDKCFGELHCEMVELVEAFIHDKEEDAELTILDFCNKYGIKELKKIFTYATRLVVGASCDLADYLDILKISDGPIEDKNN